MAPPEIPLLRLSGTHREVGEQLGLVRGESLRRAVTFEGEPIPEGRSRTEQLALADRYREVTGAAYPWYLDEIEGAAEAAEVDPLALFATVIEEIWYVPYARRLQGRCTDLVAGPPATKGGHVIAAHNNDVSRSYQEGLVGIEWTVPDEPRVFSISNDLWLSCGWNDAGITMAGNELAPLDERIGIPRMIQYRSMLRQPTMGRAVGEALRYDRASSYNQVLVSSDEVVNVEGSATDAELTSLDERGHLVHTNHYVCRRMRRFEGDPEYVPHSSRRYTRAAELLASAEPGSITAETMRGFLADHEGAPDSLCRHPELHGDDTSHTATCFWWIADMTEMRVEYGRGNPCDSIGQTYGFPKAAEEPAA
ncbi:MAG TPA: C45 family autoproteolytic acyltransferase/hydrolase [Actinomycetota bacterium]|nr:C45 family autoproteolytic acyltransferase/hydrolase [Actinomycetota bacterium]